jgi:polyhydroxyalkanoate synthesis regulator phasin
MAKNPVKSALKVTQRAQDRLEAAVREVAKATEEQSAQLQQALQDLVQRSRENSERVAEAVDRQITAQLAALGLATQADIRRLERKIEALQAGGAAPVPPRVAKKSATKKAATKKAATKKAAAERPAEPRQ